MMSAEPCVDRPVPGLGKAVLCRSGVRWRWMTCEMLLSLRVTTYS